jgi:hypothetical protein
MSLEVLVPAQVEVLASNALSLLEGTWLGGSVMFLISIAAVA